MKINTGWRAKRPRWLASGLLALAMLVLLTGLAAGSLAPTIGWWVLGAGGQAVHGGSVTLLGALGQPVTGQASGGNLTFASGYWNSQNAGGPAATVYLPLLKK